MATEIEQFFAGRAAEVRLSGVYLGDLRLSLPCVCSPTSCPTMLTQNASRAAHTAAGTQEVAAVDRTLKQSLERIRANHRWLQRDHAAVAAWLLDHVRAAARL